MKLTSRTKKIVLVVIVTIVVLVRVSGVSQYLTIASLQENLQTVSLYSQEHRLASILIYGTVYVLCVALSVPGATVLTLAGGAVFGFWIGLLVVSFASSVGATLAFLVSRFLLRDWFQEKFSEKLSLVNEGIKREGPFYLFSLRLIPLFPFFVINVVMGLTSIRALTFYWVSQVGMLAGTAVYVNAGTQLSQISSLDGIMSWKILSSFIFIGILPLLTRRIISFLKARQVYRKFPKPKRYDYDLVVLGAGSGGLVSAYIAAALKAKVVLIEKHKMGGDCLNTGCVPSKAFIRSAKMLHYMRRASEFGFTTATFEFEFKNIMERVQRVIAKVEPHDSAQRYTKLGVECIHGAATITSPHTVQVNDTILSTRSIVVATGAQPLVPRIPGLENIRYLTSDTVWGLRMLPKRLVVLGGGPIGVELAQSFKRYGAEVTIIEMLPRILIREDDEVSAFISDRLSEEGVRVLVNHKATAFRESEGRKTIVCEHDGKEIIIEFDEVLLALGRKANSLGFGLEALGVELNKDKTITHDLSMQTSCPSIYTCGDVAGPYQFTHTAAYQAWFAAVNALLRPFWTFRASDRVIPWCTFTDPEVARVGMNEEEARNRSIAYEVTRYSLSDLDRAIADEEDRGFVKVLTAAGRDKILGVTIVGSHAGELIAEFIVAMKHGLGLNKILGTIHIYPTLAEANRFAAGEWKKAHAPQQILQWVERFHSWRRGGETGGEHR